MERGLFMTNFEDVYSLLFTGIIILFLFLTIYNIITGYTEKVNRIQTTNLLISELLKYSKVLELDELEKAYFVNIETGEYYGTLNSSITSSLPCLIFDSQYYLCRVIIGD